MILGVINEKNPKSVKQLTKMLKENKNLTEEEIIASVLKLQAKGVIKFEDHTLQSKNLTNYLKTTDAVWYWITITIGVLSAVLVFTIPDNFYPWIYARNVLGIIFVLFLPGYAFIKVILKGNVTAKTSIGGLEAIQIITLSIGMSIAFVSIIGLILYYSPWSLDLVTIVFSLLAFTSLFATVAVIREYQKIKINLKKG